MINLHTKEKIQQLVEQCNIKNAELKDLQSKDKIQLWKDDLDKFEIEYETHLMMYERMSYSENISNNKKQKSKKKSKK